MLAAQPLQPYQGSVYNLMAAAAGTLPPDDTGEGVLIEDLGHLSTGDKEVYLQDVPGLAHWRTAQTVSVLGYMGRCGIPTAFVRQWNSTTMLCRRCVMMKLEIIGRRYASGSVCAMLGVEPGARFEQPMMQTFYKGALDLRENVPKLVDTHSIKKGEGKTPKGVYTDPLVMAVDDGAVWYFFEAGRRVDMNNPLCVLPAQIPPERVEAAVALVRRAFLQLERGLSRIPAIQLRQAGMETVNLIDVKMEVGEEVGNGQLVIADVVNQDSVRIAVNGDFVTRKAFISKDPLRLAKGLDHEAMKSLAQQTYGNGTPVFTALDDVTA